MEMETETTQPAARENRSNPSSLAIPAAIVIGFGMIAAAIFFSGGGSAPRAIDFATDEPAPPAREEIRPVDASDHIRGNPNAPIVFVEYSDFDCPFCKQYHDTMNTLMDEYGSTGQVAWVYRHFPLEQLHPNAKKVAEASECVAELGGNDAFWEFTDLIFGERTANEPTNMTMLGSYASQVGVNEADFTTCYEEGRYTAEVEADIADGLNAGAQGTPHTLVLVGGQQGEISGAQPYSVVKQLTENIISQIEGGAGAE